MRWTGYAVAAALATLVYGRVSADLLYTLTSPNEEEWGGFGFSVCGVADVNNDGFDDVVIGAYGEDTGAGAADAGRAYVFSGQTGTVLYTLVSPHETVGGQFGVSVSDAGDVDGDGQHDVVVGASQEDADSTEAGRAYVFSGDDGALIHAFVSPNQEASGGFGYSVSGAGDVDGDQCDDIIVGAWYEDPDPSPLGAGRAYVFSGAAGTLLHTLASPNEEQYGRFGQTVSRAGDVDGDGCSDVLVGAHWEDPGASPSYAGRAYVFSGQTGAVLYDLASPDEQDDGQFGRPVAGAGDVDGDGYGDVVIGAVGEASGAGRVYVFSGQTSAVLYTLASPAPEEYGWFGYSASTLRDVDGDGRPDLIVGTRREDGGAPDAGRAYVFSGATGTVLQPLISPNPEEEGSFGFSVSGSADVNGDASGDIVVGAWREHPGGSPENAGRAYVFTYPTWVPDEAVVGPLHLAIRGPFPNPTGGSIRLSLSALSGSSTMVHLRLCDIRGRMVAAVSETALGGGDDVYLSWRPRTELAPGVYWWCVRAGCQQLRVPMVVAR